MNENLALCDCTLDNNSSLSTVIVEDEKMPHFINISDTVTEEISLCSIYKAPSNELNFTTLTRILAMPTYLAVLFILELTRTA